MSLDLSGTLVIGISATALFDLSEADAKASKYVPSGKVPYHSDSALNKS